MSLASILFSSLSRHQPSDKISLVTLQVYTVVSTKSLLTIFRVVHDSTCYSGHRRHGISQGNVFPTLGQMVVANKEQSFLDERSRWIKILLWCLFLYCLVCLVLSCPVSYYSDVILYAILTVFTSSTSWILLGLIYRSNYIYCNFLCCSYTFAE